eukprot:gene28355-57048_t
MFLYTDGSAKGGIENGGGGWNQKASRSATDCATFAAHFCTLGQLAHTFSSFSKRSAPVLTDSQSLVRRLSAGPIAQRQRIESDIWNELELLWREAKCRVVVRWCPAHVGITGNELADEDAKHLLTCPARACDRLAALG